MARIAFPDSIHDEPVLIQPGDVADELAAVHLSDADTLSGSDSGPQFVHVSLDSADDPRSVRLVFGKHKQHHKFGHHGYGYGHGHGHHGRGFHGKCGGSPPPTEGFKSEHIGRHPHHRGMRGMKGERAPPPYDETRDGEHKHHKGKGHRMPPYFAAGNPSGPFAHGMRQPPLHDMPTGRDDVLSPLSKMFGSRHGHRGGSGGGRGHHGFHGRTPGFMSFKGFKGFEIPEGVDPADVDFDLEAHYFAGQGPRSRPATRSDVGLGRGRWHGHHGRHAQDAFPFQGPHGGPCGLGGSHGRGRHHFGPASGESMPPAYFGLFGKSGHVHCGHVHRGRFHRGAPGSVDVPASKLAIDK
ncbi:hypothetical protein Q5752_005984 [Cryptotrichosporon argae]